MIQRKKHTFYVTSRRTSYYAKHREAITVPLQITKSTYRYKPRSHIKETTTYKYSKTSTAVPKQKQRRRDQASTRRQQQHQEFNVGGIKKNHRLHKNIIPRTSRKRRRDQNKQEATRTSAKSHHQATRTKNAVQKHERDQDSHHHTGSASAPSMRHYFRDNNRSNGSKRNQDRDHQSRQQQQASSSTTGIHQQEEHTSQEQVLKQLPHPHHHTGSAYCTVHKRALLARYINRCTSGGKEGSVNFWRCKNPPTITSPSQNFGTAQKPLPRVEDSE